MENDGTCILERKWELNHAKNCAVVAKQFSDLYPCPFLSRSLAIQPAAAQKQLATFSPCIWHGEFLVIEAA